MANELDEIREPLLHQAAGIAQETPVDIESIARHFGVVEIEPRAIEIDGYLARRPDGGLAIRHRNDCAPTRIRFTVAHEVGHIMIARQLGRDLNTPVARSNFRDDAEERLANRIASELLMPEKIIHKHLVSENVEWRTIGKLANELQVSLESLIFRLTELKWLSFLELSQASSGEVGGSPNVRVRAIGWKGRLCFETKPTELFAKLSAEMGESVNCSQHQLTVWEANRPRCLQIIGRRRTVQERRLVQFLSWRVRES